MTSNPVAADHSPAFSPDGRFLSYVSCAGSSSCDVYLVELGPNLLPRGQARRLTHHGSGMSGIAWAADGASVLYGAFLLNFNDLWRTPVSGTPKPERVEVAGEGARLPAIARGGNRLAYVQGGPDADI